MFEMVTLVDNAFPVANPVTCSVSWNGKLVIGTELGVYVGNVGVEGAAGGKLVRVLHMERIAQLDLLPDFDLLIVNAGNVNILISSPLSLSLSGNDIWT